MGALDNLDSDLSGDTGAVGAYAGQVYLGSEKRKREKVTSPTGVQYTTAGGRTDKTVSIAQAKSLYLTDANLQSKWTATLRKYGLPTDPIKARGLWEVAVAGASDWYATSNGQQKVTPEQYLGWYVGGQKAKGPALPTRQVYAVTEDQIAADIAEITRKTLGREIVDTDKEADWYKDLVKGINKLYQKGTVTEVKEVKNPKTGKMEKVVTQTPGFSQEQVQQRITSAVEAADPATLERKKNLEFANWAFEKMGGRG